MSGQSRLQAAPGMQSWSACLHLVQETGTWSQEVQPTKVKEKGVKELDLEKDRAKPKSDNQRKVAV